MYEDRNRHIIDIRMEARKRNELTFYTGQPCRRGHYANRYVSNGGCTECIIGKFRKPLKPEQLQAVMMYRFEALLPSPNTQVVDPNSLSMYLARCMVEWEKANSINLAINNWAMKVAWATDTKKSLNECPFK